MWVANTGTPAPTDYSTLTVLNSNGTSAGTIGAGDDAAALAYDGTHMWMTDALGGTVTEILGSY